MPSRFPEQRAIACLEALSAGVPLVVPNQGVLPEVIALTGGGILVPPEDPEALARAVEKALDDAEAHRDMAHAAFEGVRRHFSAERMAAETVSAYQAVLEKL